MEYLNLEKSGLITILIPLNFLIGEYTLFFRLNGWSRKIIHLITGVIDLFFVAAIIASREQLYYSFVIFCGMLIGIIQSEWCYRKISEETNLSKIDILTKVCIYCIYKYIQYMHTFVKIYSKYLCTTTNITTQSGKEMPNPCTL